MIGPVDNYALTRTIPYTSYFSMLHITPGGMSANLRRVSKVSVQIRLLVTDKSSLSMSTFSHQHRRSLKPFYHT